MTNIFPVRAWIVISLFFCLLQTGIAQNSATLSGFVFDAESGESLIGANVFLKGASFGTTTNTSGYYIIPDIEAGSYQLVCQYVGYRLETREVQIEAGSDRRINLTLNPEALQTETIEIVADSVRTGEKLYRKPISGLSVSPQEVRQMPQVAEADLLRTLQTLPGILPISDFSSQLYVRGGTPDQNLYLIDGADVYNPEHFFGLFSTFNTDAIKDVDIYKGGFGADYGGRLSSILDVTNLDGNRKHWEGVFALSLLSAKSTLQAPLGEWGSVSASLRRTYFDKTIAHLVDDVPDYYFYDGHIKTFLDLNDRNNLTVSAYFSNDDLHYTFNEDAEDSESIDYIWGNQTLSFRWTHIFTPRLFANFWFTGSRFESEFDFEAVQEQNRITDASTKGRFESDRNFNDVAPRLSAKYRINETTTLKASTGVYHQYLHRISRPFISDIWSTADQYYDDSRSAHYIVGLQREVADNLQLEIEGYHKTFRDIYSIKNFLTDIKPQRYDARGQPVYTETKGLFDRGDGQATGIEFLLRKRYGSLSGWISYALSRTRYTIDNINQNEGFPPRHDRTAVLNIVVNTDVRNAIREWHGQSYKSDRHQWHVGMNFVYATGQPITLTSSTYTLRSLPDQTIEKILLYPSGINAFRLPYYARLDVSIKYRKGFKSGYIEPYLQIFNVGNRENIWFIQYENEQKEDRIEQSLDTFNMFPLIPTVGLTVTF